ncbi:MAG: ATP-binding protein [Thermomicrobiales bacterium]
MEPPSSSPTSPASPLPLFAGQQQQLETLQRENAMLRQVLDLMTEAFWAVDRDWSITAVNTAAERAWGRSRDELLGRHIWELFPEVVGTPNYAAILQAMRSGTPQHFYDRSPAVHGWVAGRAEPTPSGLIVHFQDVTDVRAGDLARQQSEERYRTIVESLDEGFCLIEVIFDAENRPLDYRFLETNPAFEEHSGLHDAVGHTARELVPNLDKQWFETYGRVARTGEPQRFVQEAPAMESRWFDVYAFRLGGAESNVVGILFTNISERKHLERLQQDFVAMASHDLSGPVTVLRARAQLLQRRQAYDDASVTTIIEQTQRMERLIDDLRELVRLETGHLELRRSAAKVDELARAATERMRLQAPGHELRVKAVDPAPEVWVDADRVAQVLDNLLANAVKYSPEGGVVTVTVTQSADLVQVAITDQGPGIDPEAIPHLFERFYRAAAREVTGGLGLGLYIARTLVNAHGGQIWVESAPGAGSRFVFTIPISRAP